MYQKQNTSAQPFSCEDFWDLIFMIKICEWLVLNLLPAVPHEINLVDILNFNQSHVCPN